MKNVLFWFSGSGNSKYVASRIAESISHRQEVTLLYMADLLRDGKMEFDLEPDGSVGFIFPTYFWGVPWIVREFVSKLVLRGIGQKGVVYQVLTCGGSTGMADKMFARLLLKRGYRVDYTYSVSMPDNYCILLDLMTPKDQIAPILSQAQEKLSRVIPSIISSCVEKSGHSEELLIDRGSHPKLKTSLLYPLYRFGRRTGPFHADSKCIGCGKCEKVCPMGMIKMDGGRPKWEKGRCTHCLACIHHCPVESLQYGKKTQGRLRYILEPEKFFK